MKNCNFLLLLISCLYTLTGISQTKILFDARKAETAGNADWIIDADQNNLLWNPNATVSGTTNEANAQRYPTPAQSGITANTVETYWKGALSNWAVDCVKYGYTVESLTYNGQITYGNSSNLQDLSNYKVYIVVEPNILFTTAEKTAMMQFVQHGGGLFLISDHTVSDRNNDGNDSPDIWNDFISNNGVSNNSLGFRFDLANISQTSSNVITAASDSLLHGPYGNVTQVQLSNGTTLTLNTTQNSSAKAVIYTTGSSHGTTNALCVYSRVGSGKVAALGDSSIPDDGTGDANDVLYNGYIGDANGNHQKLLMNITIWLATQAPPPTANYAASASNICVGQAVTYTNSTTGNPTSFSWSFPGGNPSTSSASNPIVTYSTAGIYSVSLVATNSSGSNTISNTNSITVNAIPNVNPILGSTSVCVGSMTSLSTTTPNGIWTSSNLSNASINSNGVVSGIAIGSSTITYTVTTNGCSSTQTANITINALPIVTLSNFPILCQNSGAYNLIEGLPSGGTYSGVNVNGSNFLPLVVGQNTINYYYSDINGCSNSIQNQLNVDACAGLEENIETDFSIYPNPVQEEFVMLLKNPSDGSLSIKDLFGKIIFTENSTLNDHIKIDVSNFPNGNYIVEFKTVNDVRISKIQVLR